MLQEKKGLSQIILSSFPYKSGKATQLTELQIRFSALHILTRKDSKHLRNVLIQRETKGHVYAHTHTHITHIWQLQKMRHKEGQKKFKNKTLYKKEV